MGSRPFELDLTDGGKIARGLGIAATGAVLTWAMSNVVPALTSAAESSDDGSWRSLGLLLAAAVVSAIVNTGRKYLSDNS